ncbi:MAG: phosphoribosyltransferase [Candidatus Azotimanducaceae bacterium]|nr:hypoxanthine phosphoribosyltransferase [Gammaproteobacteria bacterium]
MDKNSKKYRYIDEESLLKDSFQLAVNIYESGFKPDFIVAIWRGGATVGIYVQECLQALGVQTDHIAIRTSYQGMEKYEATMTNPQTIRVHGLQYLYENLNHEHNLLVVDDVFSSGYNIEAVVSRLQTKSKRNMPGNYKIATPFYKPKYNKTKRVPDYFLHKTNDWLVLPYELTGLSKEELEKHKPWTLPILDKRGI